MRKPEPFTIMEQSPKRTLPNRNTTTLAGFKEEVADFVGTVKRYPIRTFVVVFVLVNLVAGGIRREQGDGFPWGLNPVEKLYSMEQAVEVALVDICITYSHSTVLGRDNPRLIELIGWNFGLKMASVESTSSRGLGNPRKENGPRYFFLPTTKGDLFISVYNPSRSGHCILYLFDVDGNETSRHIESALLSEDVPYNLVKVSDHSHMSGGSEWRSYKYNAGAVKYSILTERRSVDLRTARESDYVFKIYISPGSGPLTPSIHLN